MDYNEDLRDDIWYRYIFLLSFYIILALVLAALTDKLMNDIDAKYKLGRYPKLIIQIFIVAFVVYFIKQLAKKLHHSATEEFSYDIMFVAVYVAAQTNFRIIFEDINNNIKLIK